MPDTDAQYHSVGQAHALLVKAAAAPVASPRLAGRLYLSKTGWLLLSVPNALIRGLFSAINEPGVELPYHTDGSLNAHISVCRKEEVEKAGGPEAFEKDRGRVLHYQLGPIQTVEPPSWDGVSRVWMVSVKSPELETLRKSYGLTPLPKNNEHAFHVTFAVRRTNVLRANDTAKAAAFDLSALPPERRAAMERLMASLGVRQEPGGEIKADPGRMLSTDDLRDLAARKTAEHTLTLADGRVVDVDAMIASVEGRPTESVPLAGLRINRSSNTGFSRRRMEAADTAYPGIIGDGNVILDGKHRTAKLMDAGATHGDFRRITADELNALAAPKQAAAQELPSVDDLYHAFADRLAAFLGKSADVDERGEPCPDGECCPHCHARLERGDDGRCNRCSKPWPDAEADEVLAARSSGKAAAAAPGNMPPPARRAHTVTLADGRVIDVYKMIDSLADRPPERIPLSELSVNRSSRTGFGRRRLAAADTSFPGIVDSSNDILDGKHRTAKLMDSGATHGYYRRITDDELNALAMPKRASADDEKPADCTCEYPAIRTRNMIGHPRSCGAYDRLWAEQNKQASAQELPSVDELYQSFVGRLAAFLGKSAYAEVPHDEAKATRARVEKVIRTLPAGDLCGAWYHPGPPAKVRVSKGDWSEIYNSHIEHRLGLIPGLKVEVDAEIGKPSGDGWEELAGGENTSYRADEFCPSCDAQCEGDPYDKACNSCGHKYAEKSAEAERRSKETVRAGRLTIKVEYRKGDTRKGKSADGKPWSRTMEDAYGRIEGTEGADGDALDVFLGPDYAKGLDVYVVSQVDPDTGEFDEHKVMMGYASKADARAAYLRNYPADWKGLGSIDTYDWEEFEGIYGPPREKKANEEWTPVLARLGLAGGLTAGLLAAGWKHRKIEQIMGDARHARPGEIKKILKHMALPKELPVTAVPGMANAAYLPAGGDELDYAVPYGDDSKAEAARRHGAIIYDPTFATPAVLAHEGGHASISNNHAWYHPSRFTQENLRPVGDFVNTAIAPALSASIGAASGNPVVGLGVGAIAGGLSALPTLINEHQASSRARGYLDAHSPAAERDEAKGQLRHAFHTYALSGLVPSLAAGAIGGGLGMLVKGSGVEKQAAGLGDAFRRFGRGMANTGRFMSGTAPGQAVGLRGAARFTFRPRYPGLDRPAQEAAAIRAYRAAGNAGLPAGVQPRAFDRTRSAVGTVLRAGPPAHAVAGLGLTAYGMPKSIASELTNEGLLASRPADPEAYDYAHKELKPRLESEVAGLAPEALAGVAGLGSSDPVSRATSDVIRETAVPYFKQQLRRSQLDRPYLTAALDAVRSATPAGALMTLARRTMAEDKTPDYRGAIDRAWAKHGPALQADPSAAQRSPYAQALARAVAPTAAAGARAAEVISEYKPDPRFDTPVRRFLEDGQRRVQNLPDELAARFHLPSPTLARAAMNAPAPPKLPDLAALRDRHPMAARALAGARTAGPLGAALALGASARPVAGPSPSPSPSPSPEQSPEIGASWGRLAGGLGGLAGGGALGYGLGNLVAGDNEDDPEQERRRRARLRAALIGAGGVAGAVGVPYLLSRFAGPTKSGAAAADVELVTRPRRVPRQAVRKVRRPKPVQTPTPELTAEQEYDAVMSRIKGGEHGSRPKLAAPRADAPPLADYQDRVGRKLNDPAGNGRLLVYHGLGTGKTRSAITAAEQSGEPYAAVVPAALRPNFEGEVARWTDGGTPSEVMSYTQVAQGHRPAIDPGTLIVDECMPAGTPVDGRAIETIRPGDTVLSFNHETGRVESRQVTRIANRQTDVIVNIEFASGRTLACTPNHPFYTPRGYVAAEDLAVGDMTYRLAASPTDASIDAAHLLPMRPGVHADGQSVEGAQALLRSVREAGLAGRHGEGACNTHGRDQEANARTESDGRSGSAGTHGRNNSTAGLQAGDAWRERDGADDAGTEVGSRARLDRGRNPADTAVRTGLLAQALQVGRSVVGAQDCDRGRRTIAPVDDAAGAGPAEGRVLDADRVASISVHERGRGPEFERLCPGGVVFDLTVDGNHNFFANQYLVHNSHRLRNPESAQTKAVSEMAEHARRLVLLSGSPVINAPGDLAVPMSLLTGEKITPEAFERRYVGTETVHPGFWGWLRGVPSTKVPAVAHEDELLEKLRGKVDYQAPKDPQGVRTNDQKVEVPLSRAQESVHRLLWNQVPWVTRWKLEHDHPISKAEAARLRSFLSGPRQAALSTYPFQARPDATQAFDQSAKLRKAYALLREKLDADPRSKALVYSNFPRAGLVPYAAGLARAGIPYSLLDGSLNDAARKEELARYNAGKSRVLLYGPSAAEGISTKGTQLIQLLDPHWNESRMRQARGRGLRFDSHADLPDDLKAVTIQRFTSKSPEPGFVGRLFGGPRVPTADEVLERQAARREELLERFRDVLRRAGSEPAPPVR